MISGLLGVFDQELDEESIQLILEDCVFEDCADPHEAPVVLSTMAMEWPAAVLLRDCQFIRCRGLRAGALDICNMCDMYPLKVIIHNGSFEDCRRDGKDTTERLSRRIVTRGCSYEGCTHLDAISEVSMEKLEGFIEGL